MASQTLGPSDRTESRAEAAWLLTVAGPTHGPFGVGQSDADPRSTHNLGRVFRSIPEAPVMELRTSGENRFRCARRRSSSSRLEEVTFCPSNGRETGGHLDV